MVKSNYGPGRCQFRRSVLVLALVAVLGSGSVIAQKATGEIFGHATANATVTIESTDTGLKREISADASGRFSFSQLPTGRYKVSSDAATRDVSVNVGTGSEVNFVSPGKSAAQLEAIEVTGTAINAIDVSSVESSTVFTAEQIAALPVARDVTSVALLAPGTVKGDGSIGRANRSLASFGGASVAENGYYINGFDVTNIRNFTSFASLPFEAIGQQQVKTGGYGAEFGRSLGGVINIVTKRGTNEWKAGAGVYWEPDSLREHNRNIRRREDPAEYYKFTASDTDNSLTYTVYGGGPVVKDRLFFFAIAEGRDQQTEDFAQDTSDEVTDNKPHGLVKLDWNITDSHILEFTGISNRDYEEHRNYSNDLNADDEIEAPYSTRHNRPTAGYTRKFGGEVYIAKYTGYLTDNLSLSGQYGELTALNDVQSPRNLPGAECPAVYDSRRNSAVTDYLGCWDLNQFTIADPNAPDELDRRRSARLDVDWQVGSHSLRFGYDGEKFDSNNVGETMSGGVYYRYFKTGPNGGRVNGVNLPGDVEYVRKRDYSTQTGSYTVENTAAYLEDSWQVSDRVRLYAGIRSETFDNQNAAGVSFAKSENLYAPRLGFSWDANGDASTKVFGNSGRYFIPIASNTNIRASAAELFIHSFYRFNGIDPVTAAPVTLGEAIGNPVVTGDGVVPIPDTVTAGNLKPMYQDEIILGFQHAFSNNWTTGVRGVWRKVRNGMDDYCYHGAFYNWATDNGYADFDSSTVPQCVILNPGEDAEFALDLNNDGNLTRVLIPARYFDVPKYQRKYTALEFFWERPWDGAWSLQGSYTWAHSRGNAEGYVNSSIGQGDAGLTQDFDFPSFQDGSYGNLPNDRRHTLKVFGTAQIAEDWRIATNWLIQSGRPNNCLGFVPEDARDFESPDGGPGSGNYTSPSSFYCVDRIEYDADGNPVPISVLRPRGSLGRTPWISSIDLSLAWVPKFGSGDLTLKLDVFNVLNAQRALQYNETGDVTRASPRPNKDFGLIDSIQAPRSFRFTARYDFSL